MNQSRSRSFRKTRQQNLAESAEDYTELVLDLIEERGVARVTELARRLGISHVTALRTAKRLSREGLLKAGDRAPITLTPRGRRLALHARKKHQILVAFLRKLGISRGIAETDAEGIEHHVSKATMRAIERWMKRVTMVAAAIFLADLYPLPSHADSGCATVLAIAPEVSEIRQLPLRKPLRCRELSLGEFAHFKKAQLTHTVSRERLQQEETVYQLLGIIPPDFHYAECIASSNSLDVMATYDAERGEILLPAGIPVERKILAHEIAHALQDQHFGLHRLQSRANRQTDSALALAALCEGDAIRIQEMFALRHPEPPLESHPPHPLRVSDCDLPLLLDRQNGFPYERGLRFAQLLIERSGLRGLDDAFRKPPVTTHEIMSPADYPIPERSTSRASPGFHESLGEFTAFLLIRDSVPLSDAIRAAKGWVADTVGLKGEAGAAQVTWRSDWANKTDAREYFEAYNRALEKRFPLTIANGTSQFEFRSGKFVVRGSASGKLITYTFSTTTIGD